jgi:hypothetical protein
MYCSPKLLEPEIHALFRSDGKGRFTDVAGELKLVRTGQEQGGRGQGVVACDLNNDGHIDLYVANDLTPNFLFINTGKGGFEDLTDLSGAALDAKGNTQAGMGVDAGDIDGDGLPELFVTNFLREYNTLYRNLGKNLYQDVSFWSGVAAGSLDWVGWGTSLEDLDNDGWLDIFVANGHVDDNLQEIGRDEPYAQPSAVWHNNGKGRFTWLKTRAGPYFRTSHVSRGVSFGDVDDDGDVDIVVAHKDEPATLLRNDSSNPGTANHWCRFVFVGTRSNRDAIGTRIELVLESTTIVRHTRGGRSYLSAHDPRLTVGLGPARAIKKVVVLWPTGAVTTMTDLAVDREYLLREAIAR